MKRSFIITVVIGLLFLVALLFIVQTVREGFATPVTEVYDFHEFFKPFPIDQICPIYSVIYENIAKGETVDDKGHPIPADIAKTNTEKKLASVLPDGLISCPFSFPDSIDLETVLSFLKKQDPKLLLQAHRTLVYCQQQLRQSLTDAKKSIADMKAHKEGFLTECSAEELASRSFLPLQCIDPSVEKGTEQKQIQDQDPEDTAASVKKKIEITGLLKTMWLTYTTAIPPVARISFPVVIQDCIQMKDELAEMKKKAESGQF